MRIGILSDSHDHVWNLRGALHVLASESDVLIHCGDLCSPFIVPILATEFPGPVHAVFGNNDADRFRLLGNASKTERIRLEGEFFTKEFDTKRFAVQHFDDMARPIANSGAFDVVCFGHNHRYQVERIESTWFINPGAILGYQPVGAQDVDPTFVVFDTGAEHVRTWRLSGREWKRIP